MIAVSVSTVEIFHHGQRVGMYELRAYVQAGGLVREGMAADLVVFDPDIIAAEMPEVVDDLPAGARRLIQRTRGIAPGGNGEVLLRNGKHTGALPGQLLRGPLARRARPGGASVRAVTFGTVGEIPWRGVVD